MAAATPEGQAIGGFTGLIVDCTGLGLKPVMSPVIKNANGSPIYGYKNLDYDKVVTNGIAGYTYNIQNAVRAGSNPLVVRAIGLDNHNGNPVLSVADANRVFGRVVFFDFGVSGTGIQRQTFFTDLIASPTDEWITMFSHEFARIAAVGPVHFIPPFNRRYRQGRGL